MFTNIFWSEYTKQILENGDKRAIEQGMYSITYRDLDEKSNEVAAFLDINYSSSDYICIEANKTIDTIISMLGILKTGKAFIPIDPELPEKRKLYIIEQSNCAFFSYNAKEISTNTNVKSFVLSDISLNQSAYVIYTSGSTGYPKGVEITYQNMLTTFLAINKRFKIGKETVVLNVAPFNFDLSIYDIFNTLMVGGTLILTSDGKNIPQIFSLLAEKNINFWNSVPMVMEMLTQFILFKFPAQCFPEMKTIFLSGDKTTTKLAYTIRNIFPNARVVSLGGATECAIWSNFFEYDIHTFSEKVLPYGYALEGQKLLILDEKKNQCGVNNVGEIYIAGDAVAKGYFYDSKKSAESFFKTSAYGRIYKTGDMGVQTANGYINFLGRKDRQVKIRGYRIELDEIENVLNRYLNTRCAVAMMNNVISLKVTKNEKISIEEIEQICAQELPIYMHPTLIEFVDTLSLTNNGKLDYKKMFK